MGNRHGHGAGFHHKHSLGQNFLEDEALLERLAALSLVTSEDCVLEIGAGFGTLTKPLAARARRVVSIELDRALLPILAVALEHFPNAEIVQGDALRIDLDALCRERFGEDAPLRVAANLPYYITSEALERLVVGLPRAKSYAVMVQKEVGDKLLSGPGDEGYGPLALTCRALCDVRRALDVPAECFTPPPKVDSSFMVLERRPAPAYGEADGALFLRLIKGAFAMRRKTLANNLAGCFPLDRARALAAMEAAGIGERARAEELTLAEFVSLAGEIEKALNSNAQ